MFLTGAPASFKKIYDYLKLSKSTILTLQNWYLKLKMGVNKQIIEKNWKNYSKIKNP